MAEEQRCIGEAAGEAEVLPWAVGDFFRGRDVLVTGGSGFLGRVLLEKIVFSCRDIGTVFVLLRPRKGLGVEERLQKLLDVPLFERIRTQRPEALGRLHPVKGDTMLPGLGLSEADARMLEERVSMVFHLAASVRFDDPLLTALRTNTRATRDLLELATRMTKLESFVHVSTTFCNVGLREFDEKIYPVEADWRSILAVVDAAEQSDPLALRALTPTILGAHCNTYTFTKNLAEVIVDHYSDRLPVGILRPSVVVATAKDPFPGWIDNFNGPMGLLVGAGKGVVHTGYSDPDCYIDYIPCDIIVKGVIISSLMIAKKGVGPPLVYNGAQSGLQRITQGRVIDLAYEAGAVLPFSETLYHPCGRMTSSYPLFLTQFFFFHLLPALVVDALLFVTRGKPMLVRLQRRIYAANLAISWFLLQNWDFTNDNFRKLENHLRPEDREEFAFHLESIVPESFFYDALLGTRRYLIKEPDSTIPQAIRTYKRKRLIHLILKTLYYSTITWIVLYKLYILLFA